MEYIATNSPDAVVMVADDGQVLWAINPNCVEWPAYLVWQAQTGNVLIAAQPSEFHEFMGGEWQITDVGACRAAIQQRNKLACRAGILTAYPAEIQLSMNAGIYAAEKITEYQDFLARMIAEENRVFDLIDAASDPTSVAAPRWPEV